MSLSAQKKKLAVFSVLKDKKKVSEVARDLKVSRKSIYSWINGYKRASPRSKEKSFETKYASGNLHPRAVAPKAHHHIVRIYTAHPDWGSRKISQELKKRGVNLGYFGVNTILKKISKSLFSGPGRLKHEIKLEVVKRIIEDKEPVSYVSKEYNIARKTIYEWIKRYKNNTSLVEAYVKGTNHPKAIYPRMEKDLLNVVAKNPQLSVRKLAGLVDGSSWTVWNVLKHNNLNLLPSRLAYASRFRPQPVQKPTFAWLTDRVKSVWQEFVPNVLAAPPPVVKPFFISSFLAFLTSSGLIYWIHIFSLSGVNPLGLIFASLALGMGSVFFLYSMKYYLTLAFVLSYSQQSSVQKNPVGLNPNLDDIRLEKYPFISIHIPLYNEPKVVERIIKAATNFDYQGEYEVILADDSTDETTNIIDNYLKQFNSSAVDEDYTFTQAEIRPGVILKHIHRTSRSGFKGGALRLALRVTDPKAEFVSVFDADFVPYPDTLTLFLKYFSASAKASEDKQASDIAAVQGYQWHVLNKSENWITRGVRSEYAGSYVIERSGSEIYSGLKQISGSVYMIRKDILQQIGWGTSITEDFELTLKLYEKGFKVLYTPYIQAPAECVSTIKRLVRQRMRWAEGHSHNIRRMFTKLITSPKLTKTEKLEFLYLSPYYLQAFFFIVGTISWFISETIFPARLPFWTSLWGWSLVLTNFISLPLMNGVGMFLEESEEKDYLGLMSFIVLSYIVVPFQAYSSIKGFLEREEGPWFRTPKTGKITDIFTRGRFFRFISGILPGRSNPAVNSYLSLSTANSRFDNFEIRSKRGRGWIGNMVLGLFLCLTTLLISFSPYIPYLKSVSANEPKLKIVKPVEVLESQTREAGSLSTYDDIKTPREIRRTTYGNKPIEFIFHEEPRVRIKVDEHELEFETTGINGKPVSPEKSLINSDREVIYSDIFKDIDLKYTFSGNELQEEFIIKTKPKDAKYLPTEVIQTVKLTNVNVISPNPSTFGFYSKEGKELFKLGEPNARDRQGKTIYDINLYLEKSTTGYTLKKTLGTETQKWLFDNERSYPVSIDPSVIVSGGIVDAEVQFGGLQRKLASSFLSGPNNGGTFANDTSIGTIAWTSPSNAQTSDDNWATGTVGGDASTQYLKATNFSFNMPTNATIKGIKVEIERFQAASSLVVDNSVKIAKAGTVSGSEKASGSTWPTVDAYATYGSEVDLWGLSWIETDIENTGFGVAISAKNPSTDTTAQVDHIRITVYYALWYAFYNDAGDVWYKASTDGEGGTTWGTAVEVDTEALDTDNFNPSIWLEGAKIYVAWYDDSKDAIEVNTIDTSSSDSLGTKCTSASQGSLNTTSFTVSIAVADNGTVYLAYSDTAAVPDTEAAVLKLVFSGCTFTDITAAPTATKFYLPSSGSAPITNVGFDAGWEDTSIGSRLKTVTTKINSTMTTVNFTDADNTNKDILFRQYVSAPIALQTVSAQDVRIQMRQSEVGAGNNLFEAWKVAVVSNDGTSTTGTPVAIRRDATEVATSLTNRSDSLTSTSVNANDGDRIVIEVGYGGDPTGGNDHDGSVSIGDDNATDLGNNDTDTSAFNPYVVFTNNVTFLGSGLTAGDRPVLVTIGNTLHLMYQDGDLSHSVYDGTDWTISNKQIANVTDNFYDVTTDDTSLWLLTVATAGTATNFYKCASCTTTSNTWSSLTVPYTGETNLTLVSISYDSTNSKLYAHGIMDSSEQAYFTSTDKATISWATKTSYGFTAGDLGHISSPMTGVGGTSEIGVVLRQGSNFEFAVAPEKTILLLLLIPILPTCLKKIKKKIIY